MAERDRGYFKDRGGVTVPEGEEDNFEQFLNSPSMTLREILVEIKELVDERAKELKVRMGEGRD